MHAHRYPTVFYLPANNKTVPPAKIVVSDYRLETVGSFIEQHASIDLSAASPSPSPSSAPAPAPAPAQEQPATKDEL